MTRTLLLASAVSLAFELLVLTCVACADETPSPALPTVSAAPLSADDIAALCSRLGVSDFSIREEATKELIAGGKEVIDKVAATAEVENLEVAMRCMRILKELHQRPDEQTKTAAQSALHKLSASKHRSTARRAGVILNPPEVVMPQGRQIMLRQVNVQARVAAVNAARVDVAGGPDRGGSRLQITNNNGDITLEAEEGGRKVAITHRQEENIVIRVVEPPGVGEKEGKTSEYRAKGLGELKDKHPEAHLLYERYGAALRRAAGPR